MDLPRTSTSAWARRALAVGAIGFAVFWGVSPTTANEDLPWIATLGVHGLVIACLAFGLGTLALEIRRDPRARTMLLGIGVTIAGILTAFLLIPIGLALVGIGLLIVRGSRVAAALLLGGSAGLVAAYAAGARVGMEGAGPMSSGEIAWFQVSVALTAAGLIALGRHRATRDAVEVLL